MPHFITLDQLGYTTPNGTQLFQDLTLSFGEGRTGLVGPNGVGKSTLLQLIAGAVHPSCGHVSASGKIALLHQQVKVPPSQSVAASLGLSEQMEIQARMLRGEGSLEDAEKADWELPTRLEEALTTVGLSGLDPTRPLETLSGGQRTRLRLAGLILAQPDILLLDEPTNDMDTTGCQIVYDFIAAWQGPALVVSHDRTLLDQMDAIAALSSKGLSFYGGNYSFYKAQRNEELALAQRTLETAKSNLAQARKRTATEAEKKAKRDARGRKSRASGSQPKMLLNILKERAEASAGKSGNLSSAVEQKMRSELEEATQSVERRTPIQIDIPSSGLHAHTKILSLHNVCWSPKPGIPVLEDVSFDIVGPKRIAIQGPNGCGKSSLLRLIKGALKPTSGSIDATNIPIAYLDQSMSVLTGELPLAQNMEKLNPDLTQNQIHAALARFGFRAAAANRITSTLSGGETLRAGLACTFAGPPPKLLILDEPTNHLDLETVEMLEAALIAYDGAIMVASHDKAFLKAIKTTETITLQRDGKRA